MDLAYAGLQKVQELAEPYLNDWLQRQAEEHDGSTTTTTTDPNTKAKKKTPNTKKHAKKPVRKRINVYEEMRRQEEEYLYGKTEGTCFAGSYERSGDDEFERAHDIEEGIERDIAGEWPLSRPGSPFSFAGSDLLTLDNVERGNRIRERHQERKDRHRERGRNQNKRKENLNKKFAMDSSEPVPESGSGRKWGGPEDEADNKMMDDITFDMFRPTMAPLMLGDDDVPVLSDEDDEKYMDAEDYQNQKLLGRLEEYNKKSYDEQRLEEKDRSFWEKQEDENMRRYKEERLEEKERRFWKKREEETEERLRREGYPIAQEQGFMSAKQEAEPDKRNSKAPYEEQDLLRERHHPRRDHRHNQHLFAYRPHPDHRTQHTQPHNLKPGFWERRTVYTIDSSPSASSIPSSSSSTNDVDWRRGEKRRKPEIPRPPRPVAAGFSLTFDSRHFASFTDDSRSVVDKEELKEAKKEVTIPERETLRRPRNLPISGTISSVRQQSQEQEEQETEGEVTGSKGKLKDTEMETTTFQETSRRRSEFPTLKSNFPESRQRRPERKKQEKQETIGAVTGSEEHKLKQVGGEITISAEKPKAMKDEVGTSEKTSEKETLKHPNLLPPLKTNFPSRQRRQRREEQEGQKEQKEQKPRYQKPKSLEFVLEIGNPTPSRPHNADN